jgi:HupE / UreJ protein
MKRHLASRIAAGLIAFVALSAGAAHAHTRSQSFSTWTIGENSVEGVFQVDAYRATQLSETPQALATLLRDHLKSAVSLTQNGVPCNAAEPQSIAAPKGDLRVELRFTCAKPFAEAPASLRIGAFFAVSVSHVHFVRLSDIGGKIQELVLTMGKSEIALGTGAEAAVSGFFDFLKLGFEHVLSGLDHLAFLAALAMLAGGLWRTVVAVTGFTLGHSLTLGLVAMNVLKPDTAAIEALIGFTVAWAAGDALARARGLSPWWGAAGAGAILLLPVLAWIAGLPSLSWAILLGVALFAAAMSFARQFDAPIVAPAIATVFGLAHGAGFAGPLLALSIPGVDLLPTLLAFNIGVEAGQLTALALFGAVVWMLRATLKNIPALAFDAAAAGLFALGTFWFVARALA